MKNSRVLIADAHENMRDAVRGLLDEHCQDVLTAGDEDSFLAAAAEARPNVIIVDLSLPATAKGNILRLLGHVGTTTAARMIALSVHDEAEAAAKVLDSGVRGFVLKRSVATDLIPAVREVLADRTYVSPGAGPGERTG